MQVHYFEHIPPMPRRGEILARLGYRKGVTELQEKERQSLEATIDEAVLLCALRGAYGVSRVIERERGRILLENDVVLHSEKLADFLGDSDRVVFMATTAGREIYETISRLIKEGNGAVGVIYDATASQVVDKALDWIMELINKSLGIKGESLTRRRFSPGYGDLTLDYQKVIYDLLDLGRLGVAITEGFMMIPEKTVIAIAGIGAKHE